MTISQKLLAVLAASLLSGAALAAGPVADEAGIERLPPGAEMPAPDAAAGTPPATPDAIAPAAAAAPGGELPEGDAADAEAQAAAAAVEEKRKQEQDEIEAGERQAAPAMPAPDAAGEEGGRI